MKSIREVLQGNLLIFTLGDVMRRFSVFITQPYLSLYIQALGGSMVEIGLINSFRPFAALFVFPVAGFIADRYSRVKIIVAVSYIMACIYLIFMLAPDWRTLALGNFLLGLTAFYFPPLNALIADSLPPGQRGVGYSLYYAIPSALGILSPLIGGYLIMTLGVETGMRILYGLTVAMLFGIAVMNHKFLREPKKIKESPKKGFLRILSESYRDMFAVLRGLPNTMKAFAFMLTLSFFTNYVTGSYWIIYGVKEILLSELQWGTVLLIAAIVSVVLLIPIGLIVDRFDVRKLLSFALVLSAVPTILFPFSRTFTDTVLLFVIISIANAFLASVAPTFMANSVPSDKRGRVMAALGQGSLSVNMRGEFAGPGTGTIVSISSILGSIVGGFIYSYNPTLPWFLLGAALLLNAGIALAFLKNSTN
jgi:MFS family permease